MDTLAHILNTLPVPLDALALLLALALDLAVGEPPNRLHPTVWIGKTVALAERIAPGPNSAPAVQLAAGGLIALVVPAAWGAAVVAVPVKDTIKITDRDGFVVDTPDRSQLWAIQTPQVFRRDLLLEAHQHARRKQIQLTDDAALVEQLGLKVKCVMGSYGNLKITTPEDLIVADALMREA